jgi:hypothetical protein
MVDTPTTWKPQEQINLTDLDSQNNPAVISIGNGRYLVAWTEGTGGSVAPALGTDIVGQIFDALGNPIGAEFQLNQSFFGHGELDVALAGRPGGGFVVVYVDDEGAGTNDLRIEHYDIDGNKIAGPTATLAEGGADNLDAPQIAMAADGSYLVAYERDNGGGNVDIVGKIVNADGSLGGEFLIFSDAEDNLKPTVAALSNGNFVVAWENEYNVGTNTFINLRVITPGTPPTLGALKAPDPNLADQDDPKVAALEGGGFVVVYADNAAGNDDIRAAIYDNAGNIVKPAFTVNNDVPSLQNEPVVAALHDGGFVVVWDDASLGGLLMGQRFDAAGNEVGAEFVAGNIGQEENPSITVLDDGRFFVGFEQTVGDDDTWGTIFDPRGKTVEGSAEDDILTAFADGGTVKGKGGDDMLLGTGFGDNLIGGGGADYLVGMDGSDDLKGSGASDFFVFATALDKNNNVDTVSDFRKKQKDKIVLLDDVFTAVGAKVDKGELRFGNNPKDGNDYLIAKVKANKDMVILSYDEDGNGGAFGKVKFANVEFKGDLDFSHKSFRVVADLDI